MGGRHYRSDLDFAEDMEWNAESDSLARVGGRVYRRGHHKFARVSGGKIPRPGQDTSCNRSGADAYFGLVDPSIGRTGGNAFSCDHFVRGTFWPQSVFGVLTSSPWRWIEHAGWVVFEDVFLLLSIKQGLAETRMVAERQAKLEAVNEGIEKLVKERTRELEESHKQLLEVSRRAGMAEVATSVLHNVGNILNSINVSTTIIADRLKKSKGGNVTKAASMMEQHATDLGSFLSEDVKGKQLPGFLKQLGAQLTEENASLLYEVSALAKNVEHVKDIVAMQQSYGKVSGVAEQIKVTELVEDALRMNASALIRDDVQVFREYAEGLPEINVEKHKVLQILVNLIRNAREACDESGSLDKRLTIRVSNGSDLVRIELIDNGVGIRAENLTHIFNHGFTTKKDGHGFGLHNGALAAKQLGGSLSVHSEGPGKGATFALELPYNVKV